MKNIIISGEFPDYAELMRAQGYNCIETEEDRRLPIPVRYHPDMQFCKIGHTLIALRENPLIEKIRALGISTVETENSPKQEYPRDVICNAFTAGENLFGRLESLDSNVLKAAENEQLKPIDVNQGYAACSTLVLNGNSLISADEGICRKSASEDIDYLKISSDGIRLDGYDTGFIGGCGAQIDNTVYFTGKLSSHSDGKAIRKFIAEHGLDIIEMTNNALHDIGGIISF